MTHLRHTRCGGVVEAAEIRGAARSRHLFYTCLECRAVVPGREVERYADLPLFANLANLELFAVVPS